MCLHKIIVKHPRPVRKVQTGWKIFDVGLERGDSGVFVRAMKFQWMLLNGKRYVPLGVWLKAERKKEFAIRSGRYFTGFHILVNKPRKRILYGIIVKVKYRGETYRGVDKKRLVAIAKEMYVPAAGEKI